ncbi:hypothetical protein LJC11_05425 [Bacteroidales bacterium OttesenSCG-928-I21]|nr:hypothetical protein [Bacteroidales bacterium OttesenSCG-928-I21]
MKNSFLYLFATLIIVAFASCGGGKQKSEKEESVNAYYLHAEKIYLCDGIKKEAAVLNITDNPIQEFWLSPKQDFIAFKQLTYQQDCLELSSLGIYDLAKKEIIAELGKDGNNQIGFFKWIEDNRLVLSMNTLSELDAHESFDPQNYEYTIGEEMKPNESEAWGDDSVFMEAAFGNPQYNLFPTEQGVEVNSKENENLMIISVNDDDIMDYTVWAWLNENEFVYSVRHQYQAQCDNPPQDTYFYNIKEKKNTLFMKDASYFQIVK